MKSPRFDIRAQKLRHIFSPSNIERIWSKKVRISMREQFVNDGIENFDFHVSKKIECAKLSRTILSGEYVPRKAQRILLEKSKGLCRQLVIPSVQDAIVLQCLSDALYHSIKGKAPTSKSFFEPKDHNFSSAPIAYGTFRSWLNFQKELFQFSKTRRFIIVTDIANYYDCISYTHLRNAIAPIGGVDECIIDMLIYVLADLLWQPDYTPRIEVGLPQMNLDAPRLLAHCFLYELDSFLQDTSKVDFVRFMDDIDIGADTIAEAKQTLRNVDLVLQTKQIRLNSGKTSILSSAQARRHFRIFENARIDSVQASIEARLKIGAPLDRHRKLVEARIKRGLKNKSFDDGNGEKTLKRWITLASKTSAVIGADSIEDIVKRRPSVRDGVYSYIRSRQLTPSIAQALANASRSGLLVDDAAMVEMSNHLVETFAKTRHSHKHIEAIIRSNDAKTYFGFYCKIWLESKFSSPEELYKTLYDNQKIWTPHEYLGRLSASFVPLFYGSNEETRFRSLLMKTLNSGVRQAYKFHMALSSDLKTFNDMFPALNAQSPTRGTGITHAKFLCLLSALKNPAVPLAQRTKLRSSQNLAFQDTYYRAIAKRASV